jgi:hypothetical protein
MKTQLQQPQGRRGNPNGKTHKPYLLKHIRFFFSFFLFFFGWGDNLQNFPNWPQIIASFGFLTGNFGLFLGAKSSRLNHQVSVSSQKRKGFVNDFTIIFRF